MITLKTAKTVLRLIKPLKEWDDIKAVYARFPELKEAPDRFSPIYNAFTAKKQQWEIEGASIGDKFGLYFDSKRRRVIAWTGRPIGRITNLSYYEGGGFAPAKRVSITFQYRGMTFRGICSYENMDCFTAKRVK